MKTENISLALGALALALIIGALGFQYIAHMPPCEMCHWQRWPLIAAAVVGIPGGFFVKGNDGLAFWLALLVILLVAASGAIGIDQAGVEWKWWEGPQACTGKLMGFHGLDDLNVPGQVRCDLPSFRLFGISLAGYNAIISLGSALVGLVLLLRRPR
jgi:disulfide bond formation protein DsbB